jgi:hypothetical protein
MPNSFLNYVLKISRLLGDKYGCTGNRTTLSWTDL